jgi:hypothetical protein
MARTKISEFSATAADNTDIDNINIAEGCAPSGINNAIRELMAQLKDMQTGASGDAFTLTTVNSTTVDTTNLEATNLKAKDGTAAGSIADSTGVVTLASSVLTTTDINGGTVDGTTIGATTPSTVVATQVDITAQGDLRLQDTTGGQYVALQAPSTVASSYTLTLPVDDGTSGQALITDGSGVLSWSSAASGDVYGPASATDNAVARYDGTTGKIIQNSAVTIADDGATVIAANSTTDGLRITQTGTGNALLVEDSANPDATPFVIDASGDVIIGYTQKLVSGPLTPSLQVHGSAPSQASLSLSSWATGVDTGASVLLARGDSGSIDNYDVVDTNDVLGNIRFLGADGSAMVEAAKISASVDGTPGTNDMPGRLLFSTTADGASSPTERMRIDNQGRVGIGITSLTGLNFAIAGNSTGSTTTIGAAIIPTAQSDVTTAAYGVRAGVSTAAAAFTLANAYHFSVAPNFSFGATSTVTNQFGFAVQSNLTGATNNYGFHSNIASGTGRYNFYAAGTADNFFGGNTTISAPAANASPLLTLAGNNNASGATNTLRFTDGDGSSAANQQLGKIEFFSADATTGDVKAYIGSFSEGLDPSAYLAFATAGATTPTERMRIDSAGRVGIGVAASAGFNVLNRISLTGATTVTNYWTDSTIQSDVTTAVNYYASFAQTAAASFTLGTLAHFSAFQGTIGATSAVTNQYGFQAASSLTGATNNYGFFSNIASGTGRWNFYAAGTADNYFAGNVGIGVTNPSFKLHVVSSTDGELLRVQRTGGTNIPIFNVTLNEASATAQIGATGANPTSLLFATGGVERGRVSGTGVWSLGAAPGAESLRVTPVASAVNYWALNGNVTGSAPALLVNGSDTNISAFHVTKGTGNFGFYTGTTSGLTGAVQQFRIAHAASAVNYLQVTGSSSEFPVLSSQGSSTNISPVITSKGSGAVILQTGGVTQVNVAHTASGVNFVQLKGAITGSPINISAQGSDTNIDLSLTPKGTGLLTFGTYTAGILAQAGYITIKDAAGNTRNLLVG